MSEPERNHERLNYRCPFCGGDTFTEGILFGAFFQIRKARWFSAMFPGRLSARRCDTCKNIQMFGGAAHDARP